MDSEIKYPQCIWNKLCDEFERVFKVKLSGSDFKGVTYRHIIPRDELDRHILIDNSLLAKKDYHKGINHLNSSQLLCYCAFSPLLKEGRTSKELSEFLGLQIAEGKPCSFEYKDGMKWDDDTKDEETQFDFHISATENDAKEIFVEVKFTESGFSKADVKPGDYHEDKARFYLKRLNGLVKKKNGEMSINDIYDNYQILRNILRADSKDKIVLFITDRKNETTLKQIEKFKKEFQILNENNIKFLFWQNLFKRWPKDKEKPFQYSCLVK